MQRLKNISLFQFKNYTQQNFSFFAKIVCVYGKNGSGKTNLLDAIYYVCFTKSYFTHKDAAIVQANKQGMFIDAHFAENEFAKIIIRENGKKELQVNGEEIKQMQMHIGKFPCIIIAPDDIEIINEGSENRRKFIDGTLAQIDAVYLQKLILYNKYLLQRNALLKKWQESGNDKQSVLDFYNQEMHELANYIFEKRNEALQILFENVQQFYTKFSNNTDQICMQYNSKLNNNRLLDLFKNTQERDIIVQRTTCGIHKDDIEFTFTNNNSFKETASQGQKKTLLFALKLAQFKYLQQAMGKTPLLLLDDVFEKLDENRSKLLLDFVQHENCQTFITDTHLQRLQKAFKGNNDVQFVEIE